MRNGLNIAAVSELVHEMRVVKEEALMRMRTRVTAGGVDVLNAVTTTLYGGTIRVARDFRFMSMRAGSVEGNRVKTDEQLLVALGGCVLMTFVQGCTARGITLTRASVGLAANIGTDDAGKPYVANVGYEYEVDCDAPPEAIVEIARYVSCLSPNHRAFLEPGSLRVALDGDAASSFVVDGVASGRLGETRRSARVEWVYGMQLVAHLSGGRKLVVDQPKQYLGLDSGPNAQEYLLAAAGAELVEGVRVEAKRRGLPTPSVSVLSEGSLDLRGITNLDETAPVRVHDICHTVSFLTGDGPASVDTPPFDVAAAAAQRSVANAVLCGEHPIEVSVVSRSERIGAFRSDIPMLKAYLAELSARKQEAASG